jgi:3-oxoacyl-[acyl-carrier-protein] synthase-1
VGAHFGAGVTLVVQGAGASTAVGDSLAQTAASIRAGLSGYRLHPLLCATRYDDDLRGDEPLKVAPAPLLPITAAGVDRLLPLGLAALAEACQSARLARGELARSALLLSLPAADPSTDAWGLDDFPRMVCERSGLSFGHSAVNRSGHSGGIELFDSATALFDRGFDRVVVLGADSWVSADRLRWLDAEGRCKSRRNVDGFVAGEAGAAVVVGREAPGACFVRGWGSAREARPLTTPCQSSGEGLARAVVQALDGASPRWVLADLNGESYRAREWGEVRARLAQPLGAVERESTLSLSVGDVGAASAPLLLGLFVQAQARRWAPAREALVCCSADGGMRAAARLEAS